MKNLYSKIRYKKAPLPFSGQKKNMLRFFVSALEPYLTNPEIPVYDIFGGSGLLANACLEMGFTNVTYNDYDNYLERINRIDTTNLILDEVRQVLEPYKAKDRVQEKDKEQIINVIKNFDLIEPVDCISLSPRILFSMNYVNDVEGLEKSTLYAVSKKNTPYTAAAYLVNARVVKTDYRPLLKEAIEKGAIIILDPPYLSTDISHYGKSEYWNFIEYLDLLYSIENSLFIYFTSDKSQTVELLNWYENRGVLSPFTNAKVYIRQNNPTRNSTFTDFMYCNL